MSQYKSGKRKRPSNLPVGGPFTPILNTVHDSQAYKELSGNAAKLYGYIVRVARTVAVKIGAGSERNVDFNYTYSEAKKRGFSESTFKRAMQELWKCGFISVVAIGGRTASEDRGRMSSRYQLAGQWQAYKSKEGGWTDRTQYESFPWQRPTEPKQGDKEKW
jgi:hypothetical protein